MKISDILKFAQIKLNDALVSSARLDSILLLSHVLCASKEEIIFNQSKILSDDEVKRFYDLIELRIHRKPISQIVNKKEFYGNDFFINENVLAPRPDTETLIDAVLDNFKDRERKLRILEIGVGSGCIIVSILKLYVNWIGVGIDISDEALKVADRNCILHQVSDRIQLQKIDFNEFNSEQKFDLIISNPPYIKTHDINSLEPEVKTFEPIIALDGGEDGLHFYRLIASKVSKILTEDGMVIVEIEFGQKLQIEEIFSNHGFILHSCANDLSGIERSLVLK